jgi:hypothetical protein
MPPSAEKKEKRLIERKRKKVNCSTWHPRLRNTPERV